MSYITGDIFTLRPSTQTLKAWEPLWDCSTILFHFQNSDVVDGEDELPEWRLFWIAGVALLRTIGHVLHKVDAQQSALHSQAISRFWEGIKSDRQDSEVFWNFIDLERNSLLKTYSSGAQLVRTDGVYDVRYADGQYAFDLFREAVYWWRHHLMAIEADILSRTTEEGSL